MKNGGKIALFVLLIILCSIFTFVGGATYFDDMRCQKIAETGTQTTAEVIEAESNLTVGNQPYYYILYVFEDETGALHRGETNTVYSYNEAWNIVKVVGTLEIKYNENYESVAADFRLSRDFGVMVAMFYGGIAGLVATFAFGVSIIISARKLKKVKREGKEATATFVEKTCNVYVNGSPRFRITYKFADAENGGAERVVKSKELYNLTDAVYYEQNGVFDIKYLGKIVIITEKPYSKPYNAANAQSTPSVASTKVSGDDGACDEHKNCDFDANDPKASTITPTYADLTGIDLSAKDSGEANILCEHCAAHLSPRDKHCPNCGAKVRKK